MIKFSNFLVPDYLGSHLMQKSSRMKVSITAQPVMEDEKSISHSSVQVQNRILTEKLHPFPSQQKH